MKTKTAVLSCSFCAGLLLGIAPLAQADTLVTFQVDMTAQVQGATFVPATDTVYARGSFNGWPATGGLVLTNNPAAANTNLYTGTYDDTLDTNGTQLDYKFATATNGYETTANGPGDNRATLLPVTSGSSLVLPVAWFSDAGSPVAYNCVFQVNMQQQIALGNFNSVADTVEVQGDFQGWQSGYTLTQEGSSTIYTNAYLIAGSPGQVNEFKYVIQPTDMYESPSALNGVGGNQNRFVYVVNGQTLPVVYFSDESTVPVVSNTVTFSVDMTAQAFSGSFTNNTVTLRGGFQGWNTTSTVLTNNPNAANTNIYSCVVSNIVAGEETKVDFKFGFNPNAANNTYENNPTHTYAGNPGVIIDGGNRAFAMPQVNNSQLTLPTVYYNDLSPSSVLPAPPLTNYVTFSVNMTNAVGTELHVFNPATDYVYLNGMVVTNGGYSFAPWTNQPSGPIASNLISSYLMVNNPLGSEIYTLQLPIPAGYPVMVTYKYSINGNDDEAGFGTNHVRYIRSTGTYAMPLDKFGSALQEPSFGNLAIGAKSGSNVPITWLGRPGVHLQTKTNLTAGAWVDLPGTDAHSATNYPVGSGASYFRLINPF
ncbi:MAG: hypothetical protein ABSC24_05400 [Verrucomicrobiota bacterium]|jgi:hypothetical protein